MPTFTLDTQQKKTKTKGIVLRTWLREGRKVIATKQGFKLLKDAKKWAAEQETAILQAREQKVLEARMRTRITFLRASNDYLDWGKPRWKKNTYGGKVSIYSRFIAFLHEHHPDGENAELANIPAPLIEKYMYFASAEEGCTDKTGNRHRREIGAVWTHAIKRGLLDGINRTKQHIDNPVHDIAPFKVEKYARRVPTFETVQLYREEAERGNESDYIELMCNTIQRGISVRTLTWQNVYLTERKAGFVHSKRDGETKTVWIYLNDTAHAILKRRFKSRETDSPYVFVNPNSGNRYQRNSSFIKKLFHKIRARLKERLDVDIELVTGHALRHWGAHMLDNADVSRERIGKMLDHQRPETTEIYLDEMRVYEDVAEALDHISKNGPPKSDHLKLVK